MAVVVKSNLRIMRGTALTGELSMVPGTRYHYELGIMRRYFQGYTYRYYTRTMKDHSIRFIDVRTHPTVNTQ